MKSASNFENAEVRLAVTVLQAIYDEEIAGGILVTDVPGSKKVVPKGLRGAFRVVPVTEHHIRPASYDFARLAGLHWPARRWVDYLDVNPRTRPSTRVQELPNTVFLGFQTGEESRLGHPVYLNQLDAR